jgi:hypothetical protein
MVDRNIRNTAHLHNRKCARPAAYCLVLVGRSWLWVWIFDFAVFADVPVKPMINFTVTAFAFVVDWGFLFKITICDLAAVGSVADN